MVPKNGTRVPNLKKLLSEAEFANAIADSLQRELGASHRAAKTVMAWTGVSDRTARLWLHGSRCPNGLHLVILAAHCGTLLATVLRLMGHDGVGLAVDLQAVERQLEAVLEATRQLRTRGF